MSGIFINREKLTNEKYTQKKKKKIINIITSQRRDAPHVGEGFEYIRPVRESSVHHSIRLEPAVQLLRVA